MYIWICPKKFFDTQHLGGTCVNKFILANICINMYRYVHFWVDYLSPIFCFNLLGCQWVYFPSCWIVLLVKAVHSLFKTERAAIHCLNIQSALLLISKWSIEFVLLLISYKAALSSQGHEEWMCCLQVLSRFWWGSASEEHNCTGDSNLIIMALLLESYWSFSVGTQLSRDVFWCSILTSQWIYSNAWIFLCCVNVFF